MLYNGRRLFITNDKKRKNYRNSDIGANTVECPEFRLAEGINYITFVGLEGYQGRLFYATKDEIIQYKNPDRIKINMAFYIQFMLPQLIVYTKYQ